LGKTTVIAEIGENHGGDWELAKEMLRAAASSGADVVKFQSYFGSDVAEGDPERDWFTKVQLPNETHFELKKLAEELHVEFLSSAFTVDRARFLMEELGLTKVKIASSELLNLKLLDYVNKHADTVLISAGMADLDEISEALSHLKSVSNICIMQCTTQYPCPPENANLSVISTLKQRFPYCHVGYSDHTLGIRACVSAVALGAEVIEKHFTTDKSLPGTDHVLSADPREFKDLVTEIRAVELLLGSPEKRPTADELSIKDFVRSRFPK
jgi:N,N'-diacetyllegionaminate synthase